MGGTIVGPPGKPLCVYLYNESLKVSDRSETKSYSSREVVPSPSVEDGDRGRRRVRPGPRDLRSVKTDRLWMNQKFGSKKYLR